MPLDPSFWDDPPEPVPTTFAQELRIIDSMSEAEREELFGLRRHRDMAAAIKRDIQNAEDERFLAFMEGHFAPS